MPESKKKYPKMIFLNKELGVVDTKIVKDAYEHVEACKEGWSGPPEWESALPELRAQIIRTEADLVIMRERLVFMEQFEKERTGVVDVKVEVPPPVEPELEPEKVVLSKKVK